ncbi:50S ribosomal protein L14e [Candidatus Woesearchaeota archaeon]|jgi:large subunit ribosomal protein L14e|nr:50S ribosomal protein L14e [Candidatus Woesearchaeota archaeon]MBT6520387.1 50S ribosomal protein L14e [Candidatus Woesearchaeota archaeon]MBT7368718.1 50S ribosomal protein L14e [Candidatus Woesearchaeota archaeon]
MMEVGRLCTKIAGRDSGKKCVIVEIIDDSYVLVDGETRRRKCNMSHLDPINEKIDIQTGADHKKVVDEFKKLGIELIETKPKKAGERPRQQRLKNKQALEEKPKKEKPAKKEEKKTAPEETKLEKTLDSESE